MLHQTDTPGVWTTGPQDGVPLVLVHGIRLSAHMWEPVCAELAPGHRVTAVDLPGHGELQDRPFTLDDAVEQVRAGVREALAATGCRPLVAGMSLGGVATLAYGASRPAQASLLLAHGATLRTDGPLLLGHRLGARVLAALGQERGLRMHARIMRRELPEESYRAALAGGLSRQGFGQAIKALKQLDSLALTRQITTPVILANGSKDPLLRRQEHLFLHSLRQAGNPARLVRVPGPHLLALTQPAVFAGLMEQALSYAQAGTDDAQG